MGMMLTQKALLVVNYNGSIHDPFTDSQFDPNKAWSIKVEQSQLSDH